MATGANGFLGRHVVAAFLGAATPSGRWSGRRRRSSGLGWPAEVEVVRGDLRASRDLAAAFDGVDALVHLAAAVTGGEDAQFAAGVVGTERLLAAMAASVDPPAGPGQQLLGLRLERGPGRR